MASKDIKVRNTLAEKAQKTFLTQSAAASGTALIVENTNNFTASYAIQIGETGLESTEIKVLGTANPSGTVLNTTVALSFTHPSDTPVYNVRYDQLVYKVSTVGTAGTASPITDGTISVTPDGTVTVFNYDNAGTGDAYKAQYRNSVSGDLSTESGWLVYSGYTFYSLSKLRERVKRKLWSAGYIKYDDYIDDWLNEWLEKMNNTAIDVNKDYSLGTVDVGHGTDGLGTITSEDYQEIRRVWYTTNGSDYYAATKMESVDFRPNEIFNSTHPYYYFYGDSVIGKKPDGESGTARITFYKRQTVLSGESDELPVPMRSFTGSFVDYSMGQALYLDGKDERARDFIVMAEGERERFKKQIAPRNRSGASFIELVEPVNAEDVDILF